MTRETRIGLLVGLGFIIMFGVVLGWLNDPQPAPQTAAGSPAPTYDFYRLAEGHELSAGVEASRAQGQVRPQPAARQAVEPIVDVQLRRPVNPAPTTVAVEHLVPVEPAAALGPVAPVSAPSSSAGRIYVVRAGDSLYKIAGQVYNDTSQYRRIYEANRHILRDESSLRVGQELVIPDLPAAAPIAQPAQPAAPQPQRRAPVVAVEDLPQYLQAARQQRAAPRTYVVRRGDNLTSIARRMLNDDSPAAVRRIYQANQDRLNEPNNLPVGVELTIPDGA